MHYTLLIIIFRDIKFTASANWIFHVLFFWRSFMIFSITVTSTISYTSWFVIILFLFMFRKVPNTSNYSVFDWVFFFFQSKRVAYFFNWGFIYFFFTVKRFLTSVIVLSSICFLPFSCFEGVTIIHCEKNYFNFLKNNSLFKKGIKVPKDSSAKYCQDNKEKLQKNLSKYMVRNDTKIYQKMKTIV